MASKPAEIAEYFSQVRAAPLSSAGLSQAARTGGQCHGAAAAKLSVTVRRLGQVRPPHHQHAWYELLQVRSSVAVLLAVRPSGIAG